MEQEVKKEYIQDALSYITQALLIDPQIMGWRKYKVTEVHAKRGGVNIHVERGNSDQPPYALAKAHLELVLMGMPPQGTE